MNNKTVSIIVVTLTIALGAYVIYAQTKSPTQTSSTTEERQQTPPVTTNTNTPIEQPAEPATDITVPINDAGSRITKKMYGTYVNPKNSPVSPEVFTGYHTGVDFETTPEEANADVAIKAICSGKLLRKTTATGYGGYVVQECTIDDQAVTVLYGHLRLSTITAGVGAELKPGDTIGLLGKGYSSETSNERKHLHLSVHIGNGIDIKGYVQSKAALSGWMDPKVVLGL